MSLRYLRRWWDQSRGDEFDGWGLRPTSSKSATTGGRFGRSRCTTVGPSCATAPTQVARETDTRVNGPMRGPGPGRNDYRLDLRLAEGRRRAVLLNAGIRLVAGCRVTDDGAIAMVFDTVLGEELFLAAGFRVATASELALPLRSAHLARLSAVEHRDVTYHNAQQIGEALFNWFD